MSEHSNIQEPTFVDLIDERDRVIGLASKEWAAKNNFACRIASALLTSTSGELLLKKETLAEGGTKYRTTVELVVPAGSNYLDSASTRISELFGSKTALRAIEYFYLKTQEGFYFAQSYIGVVPSAWNISDNFEWVSPEVAAQTAERGECSEILKKVLGSL